MSGAAFALTNNPFALLGLTPRDSRERIEERARQGGDQQAAALLLDPFERLVSELAWLPGVSRSVSEEVIASLHRKDAAAVEQRVVLLRGLAKANLAADAARRFDDAEWVADTVRAWEAVDATEVLGRINDDRTISGFPQVGPSQVRWALDAVRRRHAEGAARVLARSDEGRALLLREAERPPGSASGEEQRYVDALAAAVDEHMAEGLDEAERAILGEADAMLRSGRADPTRFETFLDNWARAREAQLRLARRRGREDARALQLVGDLRTLYLDPTPGPQRLGPAAVIASRLQARFPDSPAIQRMTAADITRLGGVPELTAEPAPPPPPPARWEERRDERRAQASQKQKQKQAKQQQKPRAQTAVPSGRETPEQARARLVEQLTAQAQRVKEAQQSQQKKGGCGWIIPLIIGGVALARCIADGGEDTGSEKTAEPPAAVAPATPETRTTAPVTGDLDVELTPEARAALEGRESAVAEAEAEDPPPASGRAGEYRRGLRDAGEEDALRNRRRDR